MHKESKIQALGIIPKEDFQQSIRRETDLVQTLNRVKDLIFSIEEELKTIP